MRKNAFLLILVVSVSLVSVFAKYYSQVSVECITNSDCATGGCSGEICGPKDKVKNILSTCIMKPEYSCLKYTSCKCIDGKCQWEITKKYLECLENISNQ